ncbi:hypothetical protein K488DRAFT_84810 [Vararia minispora EC-137]|uniref:Uncharacterized protein n=1 Tax=Vararia minispora EC-137 TaxID=1314806 RepID=A0ACB8QNS8_9AGAM|nr:hypothetical protein K488DRAFT_84810 [Vararia minispora EC-137]
MSIRPLSPLSNSLEADAASDEGMPPPPPPPSPPRPDSAFLTAPVPTWQERGMNSPSQSVLPDIPPFPVPPPILIPSLLPNAWPVKALTDDSTPPDTMRTTRSAAKKREEVELQERAAELRWGVQYHLPLSWHPSSARIPYASGPYTGDPRAPQHPWTHKDARGRAQERSADEWLPARGWPWNDWHRDDFRHPASKHYAWLRMPGGQEPSNVSLCLPRMVHRIGRAADNDIVIEQKGVEDHHCTIQYVKGESWDIRPHFFILYDHSRGGTFVLSPYSDRDTAHLRGEAYVLEDRDLVRLGPYLGERDWQTFIFETVRPQAWIEPPPMPKPLPTPEPVPVPEPEPWGKSALGLTLFPAGSRGETIRPPREYTPVRISKMGRAMTSRPNGVSKAGSSSKPGLASRTQNASGVRRSEDWKRIEDWAQNISNEGDSGLTNDGDVHSASRRRGVHNDVARPQADEELRATARRVFGRLAGDGSQPVLWGRMLNWVASQGKQA